MSTDTSLATRSHEENWLPILELAVEEVFEIMVGCRVKPVAQSEHTPNAEFTAMVGMAGSLCGILTVCCDANTARQVANCMLGDTADSEEQVADALGEICNMIAGNFESGSAQMKSASQATFDRIASMLRQRDYRLRIEGHTDNAPIHNFQFPSNWELSTSRATEIVRLLIVRDGFGPDRLSAAGFAEYHPVAPNLTAEGRGMNRRVDIVILGPALTASPLALAGTQAQTPAATPTATPTATKTAPPSPAAALKPTVVRTAGGRLQQ
jgi:outer membrane protein OmpA-like peptidoglycan-associated protein